MINTTSSLLSPNWSQRLYKKPIIYTELPLLVWDSTQYQLDYNHNHRPISVWDGSTHTGIVYDDEYDDYDDEYGRYRL